MEHLMEIMTTGTETFCIVLLLNTFFERKYTSYRFFFPLSAAFLFYLWLPLKHDTRHLIRHKTFYIHPHLACLFSNILYWSTSFSSLSLMFLFYHTFRT